MARKPREINPRTMRLVVTQHFLKRFQERIDETATKERVEDTVLNAQPVGRRRAASIKRASRAYGKRAQFDAPGSVFLFDEQHQAVFALRQGSGGEFYAVTCWKLTFRPLSSFDKHALPPEIRARLYPESGQEPVKPATETGDKADSSSELS